MGTTFHDGPAALSRGGGRLQLLSLAAFLLPERSFAFLSEIKLVQGRGVDDAQDGRVALDQGDVDGEALVAVQIVAGAVERVDQPKALPAFARGEIGQSALLRNAGDLRRNLLKSRDDQRVGL